MLPSTKKRPGAPKGNLNALKHGFLTLPPYQLTFPYPCPLSKGVRFDSFFQGNDYERSNEGVFSRSIARIPYERWGLFPQPRHHLYSVFTCSVPMISLCFHCWGGEVIECYCYFRKTINSVISGGSLELFKCCLHHRKECIPDL